MITKENMEYYFDNLTSEEIEAIMASNLDYVETTLSSYGIPSAIATDYFDDDGGLVVVCDKDDFFRLFEESGSTNEAFNDYI